MSNLQILGTVSQGTSLNAPSIFNAGTLDLLATVTAVGYLNDLQLTSKFFKKNDVVFLNYDTAGANTLGEFKVAVSGLNYSLVLVDGALLPTNPALPYVASVSGATVIGNLAVFSDVLGTVTDGGPIPSPGLLPAPALRPDATALTAANITANIAVGQTRYVMSSATGIPITLPPATGSGVVLQFFSAFTPTSNGYVFNCGAGGDRFDSNLTRHAGADAAMLNQDGTSAGNHNRMTLLNGISGTGGTAGDVVRLTDYIAGHWMVEGSITAPASSIAVFSSF